jgi:hypothetical protein
MVGLNLRGWTFILVFLVCVIPRLIPDRLAPLVRNAQDDKGRFITKQLEVINRISFGWVSLVPQAR